MRFTLALAVLSCLLSVVALPAVSGNGTMGTGVNIDSSATWTDVTMAVNVSYASSVFVSSTGFAVDGVTLSLQKLPTSGSRATATVGVWDPAATTVGTVILQLSLTAPVGATVYVNLTGLPAATAYGIHIGASLVTTLTSDGAGAISYAWSWMLGGSLWVDVQSGVGPTTIEIVFLILAFALLAFGIYVKNVLLVILSGIAFLVLGAISWGPSFEESALAALEMATGAAVLVLSTKVVVDARRAG